MLCLMSPQIRRKQPIGSGSRFKLEDFEGPVNADAVSEEAVKWLVCTQHTQEGTSGSRDAQEDAESKSMPKGPSVSLLLVNNDLLPFHLRWRDLKGNVGAGAMARWLRALAALPEDPGLSASSHTTASVPG